ncbi:MAG: hypothetical protein HQ582_28390, partial [Planctomycetes bacterium]|nr:hypothetical protein [Planctomycetota bacterium]
WIAYSAETGTGRGIQIVKQDVRVDLERQTERHGEASAATSARSEPRQMLLQAREALQGKDKNTRLAQDLLLDLAENHALDFKPLDRCCLYVYLGYIEDHAGNRKAAVGWHEKALAIEGLPESGIRRVAELGKSEPVVWLRHLDNDVPPPSRDASKRGVIERIGGAVITSQPPADPPPLKMELSTDERLENFDLLWQAIDQYYSFFEHKGIDWQKVKEQHRPKAEAAKSIEDYYRVLDDLVRQLGDAHSGLRRYGQQARPPRFSPLAATDRIEGKAVITGVEGSLARSFKGLQPGSVITHVDGMSVADKVEQLRPLIGTCSSDRNLLKIAHRQILHGELGSKIRLTLLPPNDTISVEVELERTHEAMRDRRVPEFPIREGKFIHSGVHPSGCGYIRILSFKGRMEIADEFDDALEALKETPALMVDVRENPGGFGDSQPRIIGRFVTEKTKVLVSFRKNGPGHGDLLPREHYVVPSGDWQYTKPVALLLNEITGSASDLFACQMLGTGHPIAVGTTTHGNSAGSGVFVLLPCGLVARVSNGYTSDVNGRIIEGNGNVPQISAELTVDDVVNGTDSVVDRAVRAVGCQPATGA